MSQTDECFRFLDLPLEVRQQIYGELLCDFTFEPARTGYHDSKLARLMDQEKEYYVNEAIIDIHTPILLVSRAVYTEAYDVMIRSNQFIRVHTFKLSLSELLPRYKIPVVNMDRQRTSQFRGYVLDVSIHGSDTLFSPYGIKVEAHASEYDFMILGRHWECFCESLTYSHLMFKNAYFYLEFPATRSSCINEGTDQITSFDESFMQMIQKSVLEQLRPCLRGAEAFYVFTVDDDEEELVEAITEEVTMSPWDDVPAWFNHLERSLSLAKQAADEGDLLEASGAFEHISEGVDLLSNHDLLRGGLSGLEHSPELWDLISNNVPRQTESSYTSRYNNMIDGCALGVVQCCLLHWESLPPDGPKELFDKLDRVVAHYLLVSNHADQFQYRALRNLYSVQQSRLRFALTGHDGIEPEISVRVAAAMLSRAEELDPGNIEIIKEGRKLLEMNGLEDKTIQEVADMQ